MDNPSFPRWQKTLGSPWTAEEDKLLRELVASDSTLSEIAEKLDRTESGAKTRAHILRVTFGRFGAKRRALSKWG
jgi:hypothetical protein